MAKKSIRVGSVLASSALIVGLSLWGCGGSSDGNGAGDSGDSGDDSGGSSSSGASGASNGGSAAGTSGGNTGTGGASGSTGTGGSAGADWCEGGCICSNGLDDDGDGLIDGFDPECTGATDNDEGTFSTGIPGDNRDPKWQDCFFDGNSGAGDDQCRYHTDCLYGTLPPDDPDCSLSQACIDYCQKLTPNGCDCFGCCTITVDGEELNVMVGSTCSVANIDDETACPRCVQTTECGNTCGECELCPGKTVEDLPDSCTPPPPDGGVPDGGPDGGYVPPPPNTCDNGEIVCSAEIPCPSNLYCSFGCCIEIVR